MWFGAHFRTVSFSGGSEGLRTVFTSGSSSQLAARSGRGFHVLSANVGVTACSVTLSPGSTAIATNGDGSRAFDINAEFR